MFYFKGNFGDNVIGLPMDFIVNNPLFCFNQRNWKYQLIRGEFG
jgi:hypothetical protein